MKNKHLVLLFLAVLAAGLVARRLPFWRSDHIDRRLIRADTSAINRIAVAAPGLPELLLDRTETGWLATQNGLTASVSDTLMQTLLSAVADMRALRIVKTERPDTLGLALGAGIGVKIFEKNRLSEDFRLGRETRDNGAPATFLSLPDHAGIYLINKHLRAKFLLQISDFRPKTALNFQPENIVSIRLNPLDAPTSTWALNDSLQTWIASDSIRHCPAPSTRAWLRLIGALGELPFADGFDESRARQHLVAEIGLLPAAHTDTLILQVFHVTPPESPEDPDQLRRHALAAWVLHSSQNPNTYFALPDGRLARMICGGPCPVQAEN